MQNKHPTGNFIAAVYLFGGVESVEMYLNQKGIEFEINKVQFETQTDLTAFCGLQLRNIFHLPTANKFEAVEIIII